MRLFIKSENTKVDPNELKDLLSNYGKLKFFDIKEGSGYMVNLTKNNF
jgi:hypothetical protein